jgi:hypothetical protein
MQRIDPYTILLFVSYMKDMDAGGLAFDGGVTDVVETLTGTPAESFETTARRYAALPFAEVTLANRIKAIANFMVTPLWPGYDLEKLTRDLQLPPAATPSFGVQDAIWRAEHGRQMAEQGAGRLRLAA